MRILYRLTAATGLHAAGISTSRPLFQETDCVHKFGPSHIGLHLANDVQAACRELPACVQIKRKGLSACALTKFCCSLHMQYMSWKVALQVCVGRAGGLRRQLCAGIAAKL